MHFILGLLGTIVTILVLLNRLAEAGISLGGLNPFLWKRRRDWRNQYEGNPVFQIEDPLDATAILMVAVAKADGDMTRESKRLILDLYENKLNLSKKDAAGLLISSSHLLGDGLEVRANVNKFLAPSLSKYTEAKATSSIELIEQVANHENSTQPEMEKLLNEIKQIFLTKSVSSEGW